jgi:hypothetical protein
MRRFTDAALVLVVLAAPAWSDDVYRWTDHDGQVHYSNIASGGKQLTPEVMPTPADAAAGVPAGEGEADATAATDAAAQADAADAFSTATSNRRYALERDLRATQRKLRELDARLATLSKTRSRNQPSTVPVGDGGIVLDLRSEEEKALAAQHDELKEHAAGVRADYAKLRDEVTARLGNLPEWWIEVR